MPAGRSEVYNIHLVECLGSPRNVSNLARLVRVYKLGFMRAMFIISFGSIILYIACILSFVWRAGTTNHERTYVLSPRAELGIRIVFSAVVGLGLVYFALVVRTFWQYGDAMDKSLKAKVDLWARESYPSWSPRGPLLGLPGSMPWPPSPSSGQGTPSGPPTPRSYIARTGDDTPFSSYTPYRAAIPVTLIDPDIPPGILPDLKPFSPQKIMDLRFQSQDGNVMPQFLQSRFNHTPWLKFIEVPHYTCAKTHDIE